MEVMQMKRLKWIALWHFIVISLHAQDTNVKVFDFPAVPVIGYNIQDYAGRIYTIASRFCDLGGYFVECSFLTELNSDGDTLWTSLIPDIDIASGSMVIVNDTITVTGNNEELTAWRMAHFDLNGQKLGETINIEHPTEKFSRMFQLTTQHFNNKYAICGRGIQNDTMRALIYIVTARGEIDTLIQLEKADQSRLWHSYIDNDGRLTTYHWIEDTSPAGTPVNNRKIFKFDTNYDTVWTYRSENTPYNNVVPRGCQLHDGRTILSYTNPHQIEDIHSVRAINPDGSKDWQHNYMITGSRNRYIFRLKTLSNGDIMGCGSYSEKAETPRIDDSPWLFRMSPEGMLLWERVYYDYDSTIASNGSSRFGELIDFIELEDGSILGVGDLKYNLKSSMLVIRVDSNGCLDPAECNEIVYITEHLITKTEILTKSTVELTIQPNPASDHVIMECHDAAEGQQIYIFDSTGRLRQYGIFTAGQSSIDVSDLSPGIYFVRIDSKILLTGKFVKIE